MVDDGENGLVLGKTFLCESQRDRDLAEQSDVRGRDCCLQTRCKVELLEALEEAARAFMTDQVSQVA